MSDQRLHRIAIALSCLFVLIGCQSESTSNDADLPEASRSVDATQGETTPVAAKFNAKGLPTVAIRVPNMMCEDSCVPTVRKILAEQPGVRDVEVVLDTKTATVAIEGENFDAEAAIAALVDMQFDEAAVISADGTGGL